MCMETIQSENSRHMDEKADTNCSLPYRGIYLHPRYLRLKKFQTQSPSRQN